MDGDRTDERHALDQHEAQAFTRYEALQGLFVRYLVINGAPPTALLQAVGQARTAWHAAMVARDQFSKGTAQPSESRDSV
jgi:hypothetical protein